MKYIMKLVMEPHGWSGDDDHIPAIVEVKFVPSWYNLFSKPRVECFARKDHCCWISLETNRDFENYRLLERLYNKILIKKRNESHIKQNEEDVARWIKNAKKLHR